MKVRVKKGFNVEPVLRRLSEARTLNSDGSIALQDLGVLKDFESYFLTATEFEGKTGAFVRRIVKKAMNAEQNMTVGKFVSHCRRIAEIETSQNQKKFKVLFPIWGSIASLSGRRRWGDVTITFDITKGSAFARRALKDREKQIERSQKESAIKVEGFEALPFAVCSVEAIDIHDAFEQAETAISKELGLYSLSSPRGKFIFTTLPDQPINTILLAPLMTVHFPNGKIAADIFWYNKWPIGITMKKRSDETVNRMVRTADRVKKCLRTLPWREKAEEALLRHYSAFSQSDLQESFLDGWRLLEAIGGHGSEKSETLVKRAAWFFEDREYQYEIGRHLMERRNLISHGRAVKDESNESLAFQMKQFLSPFLHGFLTNPFGFESLDEFWSFCDLPVDRKARLRKGYLLECSAKFRREE